MEDRIRVGVIGAGTMGIGIAQVAAQAGHPVLLFDTRPDAIAAALKGLAATMEKLVAKGKYTRADADELLARISQAHTLGDLSGCGLTIEAIVENLDIKKK
ncbi:MAG: 3-hydroxyacyl-CoA dehydrogenase NAD-binding domain-containing protein, partial [Flavobacteriales bacterium]